MTGFFKGAGAGLVFGLVLAWWAYGQGQTVAEARAMAAELRAKAVAEAQEVEAARREAERLAAEVMAETRFRLLEDQADVALAGDNGACLPVERVRRLNSF